MIIPPIGSSAIVIIGTGDRRAIFNLIFINCGEILTFISSLVSKISSLLSSHHIGEIIFANLNVSIPW